MSEWLVVTTGKNPRGPGGAHVLLRVLEASEKFIVTTGNNPRGPSGAHVLLRVLEMPE